jgi:hypothetical protein
MGWPFEKSNGGIFGRLAASLGSRKTEVLKDQDNHFATGSYLNQNAFWDNFRMADLYGQSLPDPLWPRGRSFRRPTTILHNAGGDWKRFF